MTKKKTLDPTVVSDAIQYAEGRAAQFTDIRNMIGLETLEKLSSEDIEYIHCTLNGMTKPQIRSRLGCGHNRVAEIGHSDEVKQALTDVKKAKTLGLLTSADVAACAESDILSMFARLSRDDTVDLDMRFKFGMGVLDYRIKVMKAMPVLSHKMADDLRMTEIRIKDEASKKMKEYAVIMQATPSVAVEDIPEAIETETEIKDEETHNGEIASMVKPKTVEL